MHGHSSWSIGLGRWRGVEVRVHGFFLLFAAVALYGSWHEQRPGEETYLDWLAVQALTVLLASVLWHEVAHVWATRWFRAEADLILLGPLGGLTRRPPLADAQAELLVHLAGPVANLVACLLALPTLLASSGPMAGLLHPLAPVGLTEGGIELVLVKLAFWVNWCLFLVNLLPAYPFDGGRILLAALRKRWSALGGAGTVFLVSAFAQITAFGMVVVVFVLPAAEPHPGMSPHIALFVLAILLFLSAKRDEHRHRQAETDGAIVGADSDVLGADAVADDADRSQRKTQEGWLQRRQQQRLQRQREVEAEEERRVDEILAQLHEHGLDSLSAEERRLLDRVSRRYRARQPR